jgi:membrane protein implicated in regulation of membrane protease activity
MNLALPSFLAVAFVFTWWGELALAKQVFYGIGLVACLIALVLAVLAFVGMEHHDAAGALSGDIDHGGGGIFSIKPLTGFFLGFGWAGGTALEIGWSVPVAFVCAFAAGAVMLGVIVALFRGINRMRSDGTMQIASAVGAVGTVYITLPAAKAAGGQITITINGRLETLPALNTAAQALPAGEKVRVVALVDARTLLVEPI